MIKILLVCSAGMSTSIVVNKMIEAAKERNIEVDIEAHGNNDIARFHGIVDVCLLGPQIKFAQASIKKDLPNIKVEVINMRDYGFADGEKILDHALSLVNK